MSLMSIILITKRCDLNRIELYILIMTTGERQSRGGHMVILRASGLCALSLRTWSLYRTLALLLTSEGAVAVSSVLVSFLFDFFLSDFSLSDFSLSYFSLSYFSLPMVYTWSSRVWSSQIPFSKSSRLFSNENGHCK